MNSERIIRGWRSMPTFGFGLLKNLEAVCRQSDNQMHKSLPRISIPRTQQLPHHKRFHPICFVLMGSQTAWSKGTAQPANAPLKTRSLLHPLVYRVQTVHITSLNGVQPSLLRTSTPETPFLVDAAPPFSQSHITISR